MPSQEERFWSQVAICPHGWGCIHCCWPWTGACSEEGYGRTKFVLLGVEETYAHRVAFAFAVKRLALDKEVCHSCDNPPCCNPSHLWSGTHKQNQEDSARKGRRYLVHIPRPKKLTVRKVQTVRRLYARGASQRLIAAQVGVSQAMISYILNNKAWKGD